MLLGFKTQLRLNNQQRTLLAKHAGTARHAWNWGLLLTKQILDHNRDNPEDLIKFPTGIDLHKWLVALVKPVCPWYYDVSKCAPQYALRQLVEAWRRAFKKTSKPPRILSLMRYLFEDSHRTRVFEDLHLLGIAN